MLHFHFFWFLFVALIQKLAVLLLLFDIMLLLSCHFFLVSFCCIVTSHFILSHCVHCCVVFLFVVSFFLVSFCHVVFLFYFLIQKLLVSLLPFDITSLCVLHSL